MYCKIEDCTRPVENYDTGLCASHSKQLRKQSFKKEVKTSKIKQNSEKQMRKIAEYSKLKKEFFSNPVNQICRVCKMPGAESIHHAKGKVGFADQEARIKGVTLLNDQRYWIPIHSFNINPTFGTSCHRYIEDNPEYAKRIGVSSTRHEKSN